VLLQAPDTVLIERAHGKRIDPETGGDLDFILCFISITLIFIYYFLNDNNKENRRSYMLRMLEAEQLCLLRRIIFAVTLPLLSIQIVVDIICWDFFAVKGLALL